MVAEPGKLMGWRPKAESFLKNEATDLLDNKGLGLLRIGNEATVLGQG